MTTNKKTRQSRRLFAALPTGGGRITVEWFGPQRDADAPLPVDLIDTVYITQLWGDTSRFEFEPGDSRVEMMLQAFDVGFYTGQKHERLAPR